MYLSVNSPKLTQIASFTNQGNVTSPAFDSATIELFPTQGSTLQSGTNPVAPKKDFDISKLVSVGDKKNSKIVAIARNHDIVKRSQVTQLLPISLSIMETATNISTKIVNLENAALTKIAECQTKEQVNEIITKCIEQIEAYNNEIKTCQTKQNKLMQVYTVLSKYTGRGGELQNVNFQELAEIINKDTDEQSEIQEKIKELQGKKLNAGNSNALLTTVVSPVITNNTTNPFSALNKKRKEFTTDLFC